MGSVAMLVDTSGRRGEHGGCVYGIRRRRAPLGQRGREGRGGGKDRERVREFQTGACRRPGRPEAQRQAGGVVASSCSPASPLCLPGEDEAAG